MIEAVFMGGPNRSGHDGGGVKLPDTPSMACHGSRLLSPQSREAPMLETLSAIAMFVVLGVAAFTLGGVDQTV